MKQTLQRESDRSVSSCVKPPCSEDSIPLSFFDERTPSVNPLDEREVR